MAQSRDGTPAVAHQCDARLVDALRDLEKIFFSEPWSDLRGYYSESYLGLRSLPEQQEDSLRLRHVVMLQARLMEEAYHTLQLQQCADDPANRGWMNLFRRWGASPTFNSWFDLIRIMFALDFVTFYDEHLRHPAGTSDISAPRDAYDSEPHLARAPGTSPVS